MHKFKVGDIVSANEISGTYYMYRIIKYVPTYYTVETLVHFGVLIPESSRHVCLMDYSSVTEPTFEQTLLLTKLGLNCVG